MEEYYELVKHYQKSNSKKATSSLCSVSHGNAIINHYDQIDGRSPACYMCNYRGNVYWSCYGITMNEWLEKTLRG